MRSEHTRHNHLGKTCDLILKKGECPEGVKLSALGGWTDASVTDVRQRHCFVPCCVACVAMRTRIIEKRVRCPVTCGSVLLTMSSGAFRIRLGDFRITCLWRFFGNYRPLCLSRPHFAHSGTVPPNRLEKDDSKMVPFSQ